MSRLPIWVLEKVGIVQPQMYDESNVSNVEIDDDDDSDDGIEIVEEDEDIVEVPEAVAQIVRPSIKPIPHAEREKAVKAKGAKKANKIAPKKRTIIPIGKEEKKEKKKSKKKVILGTIEIANINLPKFILASDIIHDFADKRRSLIGYTEKDKEFYKQHGKDAKKNPAFAKRLKEISIQRKEFVLRELVRDIVDKNAAYSNNENTAKKIIFYKLYKENKNFIKKRLAYRLAVSVKKATEGFNSENINKRLFQAIVKNKIKNNMGIIIDNGTNTSLFIQNSVNILVPGKYIDPGNIYVAKNTVWIDEFWKHLDNKNRIITSEYGIGLAGLDSVDVEIAQNQRPVPEMKEIQAKNLRPIFIFNYSNGQHLPINRMGKQLGITEITDLYLTHQNNLEEFKKYCLAKSLGDISLVNSIKNLNKLRDKSLSCLRFNGEKLLADKKTFSAFMLSSYDRLNHVNAVANDVAALYYVENNGVVNSCEFVPDSFLLSDYNFSKELSFTKMNNSYKVSQIGGSGRGVNENEIAAIGLAAVNYELTIFPLLDFLRREIPEIISERYNNIIRKSNNPTVNNQLKQMKNFFIKFYMNDVPFPESLEEYVYLSTLVDRCSPMSSDPRNHIILFDLKEADLEGFPLLKDLSYRYAVLEKNYKRIHIDSLPPNTSIIEYINKFGLNYDFASQRNNRRYRNTSARLSKIQINLIYYFESLFEPFEQEKHISFSVICGFAGFLQDLHISLDENDLYILLLAILKYRRSPYNYDSVIAETLYSELDDLIDRYFQPFINKTENIFKNDLETFIVDDYHPIPHLLLWAAYVEEVKYQNVSSYSAEVSRSKLGSVRILREDSPMAKFHKQNSQILISSFFRIYDTPLINISELIGSIGLATVSATSP